MTFGARVAGGVAAALSTLALGACGSAGSTVAQDPGSSLTTSTSSPTTTPTTTTSTDGGHTGPACSHVWRDGSRLAQAYHGCMAAGQGWVKAQVYQCSDGHRIVTFAHAFYASPGRTITRTPTALAHDHAFRHTMAVCGA